jgi:hypothetical protein
MRIAGILILWTAFAFAQAPPPKPAPPAAPKSPVVKPANPQSKSAAAKKRTPPGPGPVEQALRTRAAQFYRLHVDGRHRQAEALVAEDSKDFFYSADKPRLVSFEIAKVSFPEKTRRKAEVQTLIETMIMLPGFAGRPVKFIQTSQWKLEKGAWHWFVDQDELTHQRTPFGKIERSTGAPAATPFGAAPIPNPQALANPVKMDRSEVVLTAGAASSAEIRLTNQLPGAISLSVEPASTEGLDIAVDPPELNGGQQAVIVFRSVDGVKPASEAVTVYVTVKPMGQRLPVKVTFR